MVAVLLGCTLAFSLIVLSKGNPSTIIAAVAKSGFTAAFTLIFVSEIGDKVKRCRFFLFIHVTRIIFWLLDFKLLIFHYFQYCLLKHVHLNIKLFFIVAKHQTIDFGPD